MKLERIAYQGSEFTIEWYYARNNRSPALSYFDSLDINAQVKLMSLIQLVGNIGELRNKSKFNYEGDKIDAFKPQPHRFLCFFVSGRKIIITNGFVKKQDKLPPNEKLKALKFKADYEERVKNGEYYE